MKRAVWFLLILVWGFFSALADMPRCEHPRPDMLRSRWQCLNGKWDFAPDPKNIGEKQKWWGKKSLGGKIIVPFEIESPLSGIGKRAKGKYFWYLKRFELEPNLKQAERVLLHFEAVDYQARVWLNGKFLGEHTGGYTPFYFDITKNLKEGENILVVRVYDSSEQRQVRGKQSSRGKGYTIYYTPTTGIWQTVWLEGVGECWLESFRVYPRLAKNQALLKLKIKNPQPGYTLSLKISDPKGKEVPGVRSLSLAKAKELVLKFSSPELWTPEKPNLYHLEFLIKNPQGKIVDRVKSYLGLREVEVKEGRVWLNGKRIYQKLVLVQGYYPPGIYSPKTDEEFVRDLKLLKEMGFNGLRLHQKIEAKRFYYWADLLGVLVWEEMPAMGAEFPWLILPVGKKWQEQFEKEWLSVIERDFNHPSIIVRVPFNESWGILAGLYSPSVRSWADKVVQQTREQDPTRLVVDNSGWLHRDTDILDIHQYLSRVDKAEILYQELSEPWSSFFKNFRLALKGASPVFPPLFPGAKYQGEPIIISEYGGFGFYKSQPKSLLENYQEYTRAIARYPYLEGFCYTQLYDVEQERNGLLDEMRKPKIHLQEIKKINQQIGK